MGIIILSRNKISWILRLYFYFIEICHLAASIRGPNSKVLEVLSYSFINQISSEGKQETRDRKLLFSARLRVTGSVSANEAKILQK